ncbi:MAG: toll/interleukin-1 receptor domain-containing protein [Pseudomonas proteolytica]|jgi:hypothetical protein|uniref:toll/interleukin-1 receptor domain-containing protein n=1 Tax=Pseudomonas proteolytica TaxID=219574 RepID=UPI003F39FC8D
MQATSYYLAIFGSPPVGFVDEFYEALKAKLAVLSLNLGVEVDWYTGMPAEYRVANGKCTAALCFPLPEGQDVHITKLMKDGVPVIPVASRLGHLAAEFPPSVSILNGLGLDSSDIPTIVNCLLECASLLPRQRRVFLSYRRTESTTAALQLYAALSERLFDVFLDTHEILPGEHFQEVLWQKLCDSDVMIYLDTPSYFDSRWTTAEFGRAVFRGVPILRAGWPEVDLDDRSQATLDLRLTKDDFLSDGVSLTNQCLAHICRSAEDLRAEGVATRYRLLMNAFGTSLERAQATIEGYSLRRSLTVKPKRGEPIYVYPALGVPTTYTLHDATLDNHPAPVAVVYDNAGIEERRWQTHMEWISNYLEKDVRLVEPYNSGWRFLDWRK